MLSCRPTVIHWKEKDSQKSEVSAPDRSLEGYGFEKKAALKFTGC